MMGRTLRVTEAQLRLPGEGRGHMEKVEARDREVLLVGRVGRR